jgi:hypothetical protein
LVVTTALLLLAMGGGGSCPVRAADDPNAASLKRGDAYAHLVEAGMAVARGRSASSRPTTGARW